MKRYVCLLVCLAVIAMVSGCTYKVPMPNVTKTIEAKPCG
jgi:hypothetical protein